MLKIQTAFDVSARPVFTGLTGINIRCIWAIPAARLSPSLHAKGSSSTPASTEKRAVWPAADRGQSYTADIRQ